jgi:hypothetical protein
VDQAAERIAEEMGLDFIRLTDTCRGRNSSVRAWEARQRALEAKVIKEMKEMEEMLATTPWHLQWSPRKGSTGGSDIPAQQKSFNFNDISTCFEVP